MGTAIRAFVMALVGLSLMAPVPAQIARSPVPLVVRDPGDPLARRLVRRLQSLLEPAPEVIDLAAARARLPGSPGRSPRGRLVIAIGREAADVAARIPSERLLTVHSGSPTGSAAVAHCDLAVRAVDAARLALALRLPSRVAVLGWPASAFAEVGLQPLALREVPSDAGALVARLAPQVEWMALGPDLDPSVVESLLAAASKRGLPVLSGSPWGARRGATFGLEPDLEAAAVRLVLRARQASSSEPVFRCGVRTLIDVTRARGWRGAFRPSWFLIVDECLRSRTDGARS